MVKSSTNPSEASKSAPEGYRHVEQPPLEAQPKERTNLLENSEVTDGILNSDVVADRGIMDLLEDDPLDEFDTPQEVPESIEITSLDGTPKVRNLQHIEKSESAFDEGYDSDGEMGPFWDAVQEEGDQYWEEQQLPPHRNETTTIVTNSETTTNAGSNHDGGESDGRTEETRTPLTLDEIKSKKREWIANELKLRLRPFHGKKLELAERLKKAMDKGVKRLDSLEEVRAAKANKAKQKKKKNKQMNQMKNFPPTATWRELVPNIEAVVEPGNPTFRLVRAPTVPADEVGFVPSKHDFTELFDIPVFHGLKDSFLFDRRGNIRMEGGKPLMESKPRDKGCINDKVKRKYNLSSSSKPWDFAEVFLPFKENKKDDEHFSFQLMTRWTNMKAVQSSAGSMTYKDWKPFTERELRQHFGLYVLNGISPTPRVENKFQSQRHDPVGGNDFVFNSFGPGAQRRHKHFKAFLACVNPAIHPPSRNKYPNWKIRALLRWMNKISPEIWSCGCMIAVDEMTMRFKGHHRDKLRITFKAEGDGFMADALCDDGYCYQIYMRNDPAPVKYLKQGLSPLLARTMKLFDALKDEYHQVGMDNLYNSAGFCRAAFNHKMKVLCHGVTRKGGRGIPSCVLQEEVSGKDNLIRARGTVKAVVLEGDPRCPNLIASSVYDTKPVHYLSMISESIKWIVKEKKVFNVDSNEVETVRFLRLNQINDYNNGMGDVDIADQLRGVYRLDTWVRNRKWWWSMLFWSVGVLLTNAYKVYLRVNEDEGITSVTGGLLTHYEFRKAIAMYWINPEETERRSSIRSSPAKRLLFQSPDTMSTMTNNDTPSSSITTPVYDPRGDKKQSASITNKTLSERGALRCRMDRTLDHLPMVPNAKVKCALHRWLGFRKEGQLLFCPECNINLCIGCYGIFHRCPNIVSMRAMLAASCTRNGDSLDTSRKSNSNKRRRR